MLLTSRRQFRRIAQLNTQELMGWGVVAPHNPSIQVLGKGRHRGLGVQASLGYIRPFLSVNSLEFGAGG